MTELPVLKHVFITKRLQLTPEEAQKFWPIYNQYDNDMQKVELQNKHAIPKQKALLDIEKKYLAPFQKVIGPNRANTLFDVESDFRAILIRSLQNRNRMRFNQFRR